MTDGGERFLVIEWVEGEDLACRLARGPLELGEVLSLGALLADALAHAHATGIVHRDVKPANILLRACDPRRPCLVDFGIARATERTRAITATGGLIGTPGYMSPEQAGAGDAVGAPSDVFSLACVLHECVTGSPAFPGDSIVAVLAKILFTAPAAIPPDLSTATLEQLLGRMFEKAPAARPSASEAARALHALVVDPGSTPRARAVGEAERRLMSLWLARSADVTAGATLALDDAGSEERARGDSARSFGADVVTLADGTLAGRVVGATARDQARAVVRSALELKAARPDMCVVGTTGRASSRGILPTDDAIDRAMAMLSLAPPHPGGVRLDRATADLVGDLFDVCEDETGFVARPRTTPTTGPRGAARRTSLVGRTRDLAFLEGTIREAEEDSVARSVIVTAAAGVGKTRLCLELLARMGGTRTVLAGGCDPIQAAASWTLVGDLVRARAGAAPSASAGETSRALEGVLGEAGVVLDPRTADDLLEVLESTARDSGSGEASGPRHAQLARAVVRWLRAEASARAVVVVVEDLHWIDDASSLALQAALRELGDCPFALIGFARPGDARASADLLRIESVGELRLDVLSRRAAEALARELLGDRATVEAVELLVGRAGGNPLHLEELARAFLDNGLAQAHASLEALIEARLLQLPEGERRVLRAASVFGGRFWSGGVEALLVDGAPVAEMLERLRGSDIIVERPSRFVGHREYAFAQALFRDAAYAMLTERDRRAAHVCVAGWLEAAGESDVAVLAEHWLRGATSAEEKARAVEAALTACEGATAREALSWLDRADHVAGEAATELPQRTKLRLLGRRARALSLSDRSAARAPMRAWLDAARNAGSPEETGTALASLAILEASAGDFEAALGAVRQGQAIALASGMPSMRAAAANAASIVAYYRGDLEAGIEASLVMAESSPDPRLRSLALHNAADAALRLGRFGDALRLLDGSDAAFEGLSGRKAHNEVLRVFIRSLREGLDWRAEVIDARRLAEANDETWRSLEIQLFQAMLEAWTGDGALARAAFEELALEAEKRGHPLLAAEARECERALLEDRAPWFRGGTPPERLRGET